MRISMKQKQTHISSFRNPEVKLKGRWNLTARFALVCALTEMCDVTKWEFEPDNISPTYFGQLSFGDGLWNLPIQKATHGDLDNPMAPEHLQVKTKQTQRVDAENTHPQGNMQREGSESSSPPYELKHITYYSDSAMSPFLFISPP